MNWLRKMLGLCVHKWFLVKQVKGYDFLEPWMDMHLRCTKCGKKKVRRL